MPTKRKHEADFSPMNSSCGSDENQPLENPLTGNLNNNGSDLNAKKVKLEEDPTNMTSSQTSNATTPTFNNGNANSSNCDSPTPQANGMSDNGNQAGPSKVVHIRNIPNEANDSDIINLGLPFGKIANILLLKGKNQAFIEFSDISSAQCMVSYWAVNSLHTQPTVRGRNVFCQFSNHQALKPHENNNPRDGPSNGSNGRSSPPSHGGETAVLRVVVDTLLYPVTLDTFYQLFSRFGKVNKIVTFTKNNSLQALVQFDGSYAAQSAKANLDGQAMFGGTSNILRVDFSKLTSLNVKYNNDKSRDYTNPHLPPGNTPPPYGSSSDLGGSHHMGGMDPLSMGGSPHSHGGMHGSGQGMGFGNGSSGGGRRENSLVAASMAAAHHALLGFGTVLLVSNLPEQMATPDALFTMFGVYGDVMRVKVLFNKKDNALVQMAEPPQASLALTYLDKLKLFGKQMRVTASKHGLVQLPKEGQPDSGLTKD